MFLSYTYIVKANKAKIIMKLDVTHQAIHLMREHMFEDGSVYIFKKMQQIRTYPIPFVLFSLSQHDASPHVNKPKR